MRSRHLVLFALLSQALACAAPGPMRAPTGTPSPRVWEVNEVRPGSRRTLALGSATVSGISGNLIFAPGTTPYGRASDSGTNKYRFNIATPQRALRAECQEQANDAPYFGLGKVSVDLYCTCADESGLRSALLLSEGRGEAALASGQRYGLWESHEEQSGRRVRPILGYRLQGGGVEGALDITEQPRAYVPANVSVDQELPLACLYAALLLHTPLR